MLGSLPQEHALGFKLSKGVTILLDHYSFNYKGFAVETIEKHRRRGVEESLCFQLIISDEAYESIRDAIEMFKEKADEYSYTRLGVCLAVLNIPYSWKKHYFCSHFVAHLLVQSKALILQRDVSVYLPNQLIPELYQSKRIKQTMYNVV